MSFDKKALMNVADMYFSVEDIEQIAAADIEQFQIEDDDEIVRASIDATLDYVIDWLNNRGNEDLSNLLHLLTYEA